MPDIDGTSLRERIHASLDEVIDPCSVAAAKPMGLSEMGLVDEVVIDPDGHVSISLRLTSPFCHMIGFLKSETLKKVGELEGVSGVSFEADAGLDWSPSMISASAQERHRTFLGTPTRVPS